MYWLYPYGEDKDSPKIGVFPVYHLIACDMEAPVLEIWEIWSTPS